MRMRLMIWFLCADYSDRLVLYYVYLLYLMLIYYIVIHLVYTYIFINVFYFILF